MGSGSIFVALKLDSSEFDAKLGQILTDTNGTTTAIDASWRALGSKSNEWFDQQRNAAQNAYTLIAASAGDNSAAIIRAEEAKNAKISELNTKQFGETKGWLDNLVGSWTEGAAAMVTGWLTINGAMALVSQGMDAIRAGAKAMQAEEAFKNVAESVHVNAEQWIPDLKRVTNETVDDSDLMQQAMKMASRGMDPAAITDIFEIARVAARRMGVDVGEAVTSIGDAIENMRSRALVQYGLLSPEEAKWIARIKSAGEEYDALALIMANVYDETIKMGGAYTNASEVLQQHTAHMKDLKDTIGKDMIGAIELAIEWFAKLDAAIPHGQGLFEWFGIVQAAEEGLDVVTKSLKVTMDSLNNVQDWGYGQDINVMNAEMGKSFEEAKLQAKAFAAAALEAENEAIVAANAAIDMSNKLADMWTHVTERMQEAAGGQDSLSGKLDAIGTKYKALAEEVDEYGHKYNTTHLQMMQEMEEYTAKLKDWQAQVKVAAEANIKYYEDQNKAASDFNSLMNTLYNEQADMHSSALTKLDAQDSKRFKFLQDWYQQQGPAAEQQYNDAVALMNEMRAEKVAKIEADLAEKRTSYAAASYANIKGMEDQWLAASMAAIDAKAAKEREAGMDGDAVAAASYAARTKLLIDYGKKSDDVAAGAQAAWLELYQKQETWGQASHDTIIGIYATTEKDLESVFFDAFSGKLKSASDYWDAFCSELYKVFAATLAKLVVAWAASGVMGILGDLGVNIGGAGGGTGTAAAGGGGITGYLSSLSSVWSGASKLTSGTVPSPMDAAKNIYDYLTGANNAGSGVTDYGSLTYDFAGSVGGFDLGGTGAATAGIESSAAAQAAELGYGLDGLATGAEGAAAAAGILDAGIGGLCTTVDGLTASFAAMDMAATGAAEAASMGAMESLLAIAPGLGPLGAVLAVVGIGYELSQLFNGGGKSDASYAQDRYLEQVNAAEHAAQLVADAQISIATPNAPAGSYTVDWEYYDDYGLRIATRTADVGLVRDAGGLVIGTLTKAGVYTSTEEANAANAELLASPEYVVWHAGGVFDNGNILPFARGGVVDTPTIFPMARGMGLMGEAGPEGVLPLARTAAGDLGVKSSGGRGDIHIYIDGEKAMQITADGVIVERNQRGIAPTIRVY